MGFCAASVGFRKEEAFEKKALLHILNMRFSAAVSIAACSAFRSKTVF